MDLVARINELKKTKNAVICAHYYVADEIQQIADYVGDSFYLAKVATKIDADVVVFCGVKFMGESAKILNPDKVVLMPDANADCPMAHMASIDRIEELRREYDDLCVVCYVNSTAELKSHSDVCVTSSNALKIVESLPNKNIFFIPDKNLGGYVKQQVKGKNIILNDGYCPIHENISLKDAMEAKSLHPDAKLIVHPECREELVAIADYVGSTAGMIEYVKLCDATEFIVGTEVGIMYELTANKDKKFYPISQNQICKDMKLISLEKIAEALETMSPQVKLDSKLMELANKPLTAMLELA